MEKISRERSGKPEFCGTDRTYIIRNENAKLIESNVVKRLLKIKN